MLIKENLVIDVGIPFQQTNVAGSAISKALALGKNGSIIQERNLWWE